MDCSEQATEEAIERLVLPITHLHPSPRTVLHQPLSTGKPPFLLHLRLQVYPLDHHSLSQPSTRHLLFLQLRRDLMENRCKSTYSPLTYSATSSKCTCSSDPLPPTSCIRFSCADDKLVWLVGLAVQGAVCYSLHVWIVVRMFH